MQYIGSVIGALVVGILSIFAIVISQGIVSGQDTSGWPAVLTSIVTNIAPVGRKTVAALKRNLHRTIALILEKAEMLIAELNTKMNREMCTDHRGNTFLRSENVSMRDEMIVTCSNVKSKKLFGLALLASSRCS